VMRPQNARTSVTRAPLSFTQFSLRRRRPIRGAVEPILLYGLEAIPTTGTRDQDLLFFASCSTCATQRRRSHPRPTCPQAAQTEASGSRTQAP
jgi:hypothetical protein